MIFISSQKHTNKWTLQGTVTAVPTRNCPESLTYQKLSVLMCATLSTKEAEYKLSAPAQAATVPRVSGDRVSLPVEGNNMTGSDCGGNSQPPLQQVPAMFPLPSWGDAMRLTVRDANFSPGDHTKKGSRNSLPLKPFSAWQNALQLCHHVTTIASMSGQQIE